jgi:hypothetical protein
MAQVGTGIRGPTGPDKANDHAGNAAVGSRNETWSGSGNNQPSRVSRNLAPASSVGGVACLVKRDGRRCTLPCPSRKVRARAFGNAPDHRKTIDKHTGAVRERAGLFACGGTKPPPRQESGTTTHE